MTGSTIRIALVALACAVAWSDTGRSSESVSSPASLMRALRAHQDRIARGDVAAHASLRQVLADLADQMTRMGPEAWQDAKSRQALASYVLSGGDPRVLRAVLGVRTLSGDEDRLLKGVLAYSEGRNDVAAELFAEIDVRRLDASIAGHVALVQATLIAKTDPARASARLDEARLLSPGTLVEEAALRRQAFLILSTGDLERFLALTSQYLRRFNTCVYAETFRQQLASELVRRKGDKALPARLEAILSRVEPTARRDTYLALAREGAFKGNVDIARFAAVRAEQLTGEGTPEKLRAIVYQATAQVVGDDLEAGLVALQSVDASRLPKADADLADAAIALAAQVRRMPSAPSAESQPKGMSFPARAQKALVTADQILSKAHP